MADPREAVDAIAEVLADCMDRPGGLAASKLAAALMAALPSILAEHPEAFGLVDEDVWVYVPDESGDRWDHRVHYEDETPESVWHVVAPLYRLPSRGDTTKGDATDG